MSDYSQGDLLAQFAMDQATNAADLDWLGAAGRALDVLVVQRRPFVSEDILLYCESFGYSTGDNRALGGLIRSAAREGRIRATGEWRTSSRPQSHSRPMRVWKAA